jgi:hypothetical protein
VKRKPGAPSQIVVIRLRWLYIPLGDSHEKMVSLFINAFGLPLYRVIDAAK